MNAAEMKTKVFSAVVAVALSVGITETIAAGMVSCLPAVANVAKSQPVQLERIEVVGLKHSARPS
jgi:hypothetical protein